MALFDYDNVVNWRWGFLTWRLRFKIVFVALVCTALYMFGAAIF